VQSVALRLVCDRELEIEKFVAREYWSLVATLATPRAETFEARLVGADGRKITRLDIGTGDEAAAFKRDLDSAQFSVAAVEAKPARRNPPPPFTTSTLQQEASRKLGFAPAHTMRVAQRLYEGVDIGGETFGLITYMRTDGVFMAPEAIAAIRADIASNYGKQYVPTTPRLYQNKQKNAQEAHEAVRPADPTKRPRDVSKFLEPDQAKLYELIWLRAMASQMESAEMERTTVDIIAKVGARALELRANGTVIKFDGFLALYQEGHDDDDEDEESKRLPAMSQGEALAKRAIASTQHFTEPPPRFSEASLVKRMEELGIGRPSTYASILQVLKDRNYVRLEKKRLYAEDKGRVVIVFLENFFARYVEYEFTASLEEDLDRISNGEVDWRAVLRDFWRDFIGAVDNVKDVRVREVLDVLDEILAPHLFPPNADGTDQRLCPTCGNGRLGLKLGRFGAFIGCSNYPDCRHTRQLSTSGGAAPDKVLGKDPETGLDVAIKSGRFGTYLQLGEASKDKEEKPKRAGIPKGWVIDEITLESALKLLSLPREIGKSPEDGELILAGIGRFGPFVQQGKTYANLDASEDVFSIGLNRAITLIAEKKANPGKGRRFGADPGRALGDHPQRGGPILVKKGRYGPYVTNSGINATIPDDKNPEEITLEEAVALIEARADKTGAKPAPRRKEPRKAAAARVAKPVANGDKKPEAAARKGAPKKKTAAKRAPKKTVTAAE
jgi:DNA topoisomerase-1